MCEFTTTWINCTFLKIHANWTGKDMKWPCAMRFIGNLKISKCVLVHYPNAHFFHISAWNVNWLAGWLTLWLADNLAGRQSGWTTNWLADNLAGRQTGWLAYYPAGWLSGWLAGWQFGWLTVCLPFSLSGCMCDLLVWDPVLQLPDPLPVATLLPLRFWERQH